MHSFRPCTHRHPRSIVHEPHRWTNVDTPHSSTASFVSLHGQQCVRVVRTWLRVSYPITSRYHTCSCFCVESNTKKKTITPVPYLHGKIVENSLAPLCSHAQPQRRVACQCNDGRAKCVCRGKTQEPGYPIDDRFEGSTCRHAEEFT